MSDQARAEAEAYAEEAMGLFDEILMRRESALQWIAAHHLAGRAAGRAEGDEDNRDLCRRAVRHPVGWKVAEPRWVAVKRIFAIGSTRAAELCRACDVDPNELRAK